MRDRAGGIGRNSAQGDLLICESADDTYVLRQLGFQALEANDFLELTGTYFQSLFEGDQRTDHAWRYRLIVMDWDVADLNDTRRPTLQALIKRLADVQTVYGIDPRRRFSVSRPEPHDFAVIQSAVSLEDLTSIAMAIRQTWDGSKRAQWSAYLERGELTLPHAKAQLARAIDRARCFPNRSEVEEARDAFLRAGSRYTVAPIDALLDAATNPFTTRLLMHEADLAQDDLESHHLVVAANKYLANESLPPAGVQDVDYIEDRLKRHKRLLQLRRA